VEVLEFYSNLCDQGKRLRHLLEIVPAGPRSVNVRTRKQIQHRLDSPQAHRLRQAYKSGATLKELARDFNINRHTAADLLERGGIPRRGKGPSDFEVGKAIQLYDEGKSTAAIGELLGFSAETIRHRLIAAGTTIRGPHRWRNPPR
jgi:DNA-binding CsgD family transcriptional regulator